MDIKTEPIISKETLKKHFGYDNFLKFQKHFCQKVFEGTNDVYLNLPPGYGKSLCFQLPTVLKCHTLAVVFVPRDILAKAQILFLRQHGINADYVCTRSCTKRLEATISSFKSKNTKKIQFLYVLVQKQIVDLVKDWIVELNARNALSYIVFDEAHCASSLSHDYVPAYQDVVELVRKTCPNVCKIALTATATTEVRRDIISKLGMKNVAKIRDDIHRRTRHDLYHDVYHDVYFIDTILKPWDHLTEFINKRFNESSRRHSQVPQTFGIIFCRKRDVVNNIASYLRTKNILAEAYHGALSLNDREAILGRWTIGDIRVIVTTHVFGIGLHKPNVRFVVHWNLPLSFQQMYQESGRVSQEKGSYCRVYYSYYEEESITTYLKSLSIKSGECIEVVARKLKFFEEVINYCFEIKCRHVARYKYFELIVPACGKQTSKQTSKLCDACSDVEELKRRVNACLKYRESEKKGTANKLAYEEVKSSAVSLKTKTDCTANKEENDTGDGPTRSVRYRSLNRLIHELMENYKKNHKKVEKYFSEFDVTEIALRLEYSLYNGAADECSKYNHHVVVAVFNIRRATQSGLACIHFVAQEKHVFYPAPNVIVNPKPVINDSIIIID